MGPASPLSQRSKGTELWDTIISRNGVGTGGRGALSATLVSPATHCPCRLLASGSGRLCLSGSIREFRDSFLPFTLSPTEPVVQRLKCVVTALIVFAGLVSLIVDAGMPGHD